MIKDNNSASNSNPNLNPNLKSSAKSAEPGQKKHFPYYKFVIYSFLLVILMLPALLVVANLISRDPMIRAFSSRISVYHQVPELSPVENCRVINTSASLSYMVPVRTLPELQAFKAADARLTDLSMECYSCQPRTCSDLAGLAAVNNGFDCGQGLSDGCGGLIDCFSNCAAGSVCSKGAAGSPCDLGLLNECDRNAIQGHCEADNDCIPVVDNIAVNSNIYGRAGCLNGGPFIDIAGSCATPQASPLEAIFIRGGQCYVGPPTGLGGTLTGCFARFSGDLPLGHNFYALADGVSFNRSYFEKSGIIGACPVGGGGTDCTQSVCYTDCMLLHNDANMCHTNCCTPNQI